MSAGRRPTAQALFWSCYALLLMVALLALWPSSSCRAAELGAVEPGARCTLPVRADLSGDYTPHPVIVRHLVDKLPDRPEPGAWVELQGRRTGATWRLVRRAELVGCQP